MARNLECLVQNPNCVLKRAYKGNSASPSIAKTIVNGNCKVENSFAPPSKQAEIMNFFFFFFELIIKKLRN